MNIIILSLLFFFVLSCKEESKGQENSLNNEWDGRQIVFPENLIFTRYATDSIDFEMPQSEYKVLVYVDSIGCTSCKLQLHKWKEFIEYTDSVTERKVPFLFFFHPKDRIEIRYLLKSYEIELPVCIDLEDQLNKLNHFPADTISQTFLLDKNNKVLMLGNPIHDTTIKELYLKQLIGKENPTKNILKTTAEATQLEIDFGTFDKSKVEETTVEIKNTGENPLVIVDVSTTCGCIAATYDKQPAKSRESLRVGIKMTLKGTGFFDEVVTIKYNSINNQPVKVKIKGNVR